MDTKRILSMLKACTTSKSLKQGKLLHQKIILLGLQNNISLCKYLINLYFSCHLFEYARLVFQTVDNPLEISLWNGLIAAYTRYQLYSEALQLFQKLQFFPHLKPDNFTYPSVLKACSGLQSVEIGKKIHTHVIKTGFEFDVVVASSLVGMYAKCGLFDLAIQLFNEMPNRDVACWNTVVSCYYQNGQPEKALDLFEKMKSSGFQPDSVTFTTVLSACARLLDLESGKEIHREVKRTGFHLDGFISSALVDMYGKCGCLEMAREVFEQIPMKSVVSWNLMIAAYSLTGDSHSCLELFRRMNEEGVKPTSTTLSSILIACSRLAKLHKGKFIHGYIIRNEIISDIFIYSSLVDLYFKCGSVISAEHVFKEMPKTHVVSWNVMISGYVTIGYYFEALHIFYDMRVAGVKPDSVTFTSILPACSQLAALEQGKEIHKYVKENGFESDEKVMGALLDMYAKCGTVEEARQVFDRLPVRDFVSWTSMITAYGSHGQAFKALELFSKMQDSNAKPDKVTFLAIMSACSHAGLIDEGCYFFNQMTASYGIKPTLEHYSCLIDLLGRAGRLREAYSIIQNTPSIQTNFDLLSTLFSACNMHDDLELGEKIARLLIEEDPNDPSTYVTLSNMYASIGKWNEVRKVRLKMKKLGLKKSPGCSWIEIDKTIHPFFVDDKSHPRADVLYVCLENLFKHMEKDEILLD
ncbi:PREDICTED: pentatricopeptide repeat-containing protein At5g27110 [Nelumbo nucifera]|uniref:Pentatricopeptide repeat-containing protein At5g27110 n=1 Tax=Nelumbo nucifera TaxID=4432 RepID=A0A1U8Q602_NELNU|nr:PREDICTED: pentatricopeptide repeat-containing protein At5g27110 [Nelumbo nucifera]